MAVNKVVFGAVAIMDISDSTVTPETLAKDAVAYAADGERIVGTLEAQEPALQSKTVSPSTSSQTVKPDSGYDGLSQVTVNAMPTATQATPSVSVDANGKITATATQSAGYVAAGTKTGTKQMTTQAAKTITPSTSSQTAVAKNVYTTGAVTVAAIPSKYQDVTAPLAELNTANGGTAASTMAAAVDNTEALTGTQTDLIAQIASALEGKAAGGGSVETCNLTIDTYYTGGSTSTGGYINYAATVLDESGNLDVVCDVTARNRGPFTINNVIVGSCIYFTTYGISGGIQSDKCELIQKSGFHTVVKVTGNGNGTLIIWDAD